MAVTVHRASRPMPRADALALLLVLASFSVPYVVEDPFLHSVVNQVLIAVIASLSVYLMLRINLMTFAVPAFMAVGGYTVAILSLKGVTDVMLLGLASFAVPALVALPIGTVVLRLRGVYFVLVTFVLSEILTLLLFEAPGLTGGASGISGIPSPTLFGKELAEASAVLLTASGLATVAALITYVFVRNFRQQLSAINENETLAASLGLVAWRYKVTCFVIAAGLGGLAGFALVNMLMTAHPTSFATPTSVNYIAYAIVGGTASMLGPLIGSAALVSATNLFGSAGMYSQGLFGALIMIVILVARGGIVGTVSALLLRMRVAAVAPDKAADVAEGVGKTHAH